jgi:hypothetical protein
MLRVGFGAWLVGVISLIQLPFNAKPASITGWLRLNPLNVMLYTDKLTPRGLAIRRRMFIALIVFVSAILAGLGTGGVAKVIGSSL